MSEKQKRPGCIKMGIICFEILGAVSLIFAFFDSFSLFEQFSDRKVEILITTVPVFFIVISWINFFSPIFPLWKNRSPLIKAIVLGLAVLPTAIFALPFVLSTFFGEPEFDPYRAEIVSARQYLAEAGVWIGVAINLRRSFPTTTTAEHPSHDSQSALA